MLKPYKRKFDLLLFRESNLPDAMKNMTKVLSENDIDFCFIGGVVVYNYGYKRTTTDIDILVDIADKDKFLNLRGRFFKRAFEGATMNFLWNTPKASIDVLYSGTIAGNNGKGIEYLKPSKIKIIRHGLPMLDLVYLISYKLSTGIYSRRLKDFSDVQELIRINKLKRDFCKLFRRDLKEKYLEIWDYTNGVV